MPTAGHAIGWQCYLTFAYGMPDKGLRDACDREKRHLAELIEKLKNAFSKDIIDIDRVAFAVHVP